MRRIARSARLQFAAALVLVLLLLAMPLAAPASQHGPAAGTRARAHELRRSLRQQRTGALHASRQGDDRERVRTAPVFDATPTTEPTPSSPGDSTLAPGVTLSHVTVRTADGPNRASIIHFDPSAKATLDVVTARTTLPGTEQTSDMATRAHALAAINGDYGLYPSRPGHALAQDGMLQQTSPLGRSGAKAFAIRQDGAASYIGRPKLSILAEPSDGGGPFEVAHWNEGGPKHHEIVGFSRFGGRLEPVPGDVCAARLVPLGAPAWGTNQEGVTRSYTVVERRCGPTPLDVGNGIVLAARTGGTTAAKIQGLAMDEQVSLNWSLGWPGVTELIGGSPVLVEDGAVVVEACDTYLCGRQPRTAIGIAADGSLLLVVIDGRDPEHSIGMTLVEEASFMKQQGAVWAMNLDGGGSSTMWVKGQGIVNNPSDGSERSVSGALIILPGEDPGEPTLTPRPASITGAQAPVDR